MGDLFHPVSSNDQMIKSQIMGRGIRDSRVIHAFQQIDRKFFVPREKWSQAYNDHPIAIGDDQTISQPYMVAVMTELLQAGKNDKILEIGTGSGYQTAILSLLAREVYSVEIISRLSRQTGDTLEEMGIKNVHLKVGDGCLGWPEEAPFDGIMVTAAPEDIPDTLLEQLSDGGRMVIPVGRRFQVQTLYRAINREGEIILQDHGAVAFVPMVKKG